MPVQHIQGISPFYTIWLEKSYFIFYMESAFCTLHPTLHKMPWKNGWRAESEPGLELESTMSHGAMATSKEMSWTLCHSIFHKSMLWRRERPVTPDFEKFDDR